MIRKIRYVECGECEGITEAAWLVDGWIIHQDSMIEDSQREKADPFMASHLSTNKEMKACPKCEYDFSQDKSAGFCLVNHQDNTACIKCSGCGEYIENGAIWHKTEWDRSDLIIKEVEIQVIDPEDTKDSIFYKMDELMIKDFKIHGKLRDLE